MNGSLRNALILLGFWLVAVTHVSAQAQVYGQPAVDLERYPGQTFGPDNTHGGGYPPHDQRPDYHPSQGQPGGPIPHPGPQGNWGHMQGCNGACAWTEFHSIEYRPVLRSVISYQSVQQWTTDSFGYLHRVYTNIPVRTIVTEYVQVHVIRRIPGCSQNLATAYFKQEKAKKSR